jgi:hypothetical protein
LVYQIPSHNNKNRLIAVIAANKKQMVGTWGQLP